MNVGRASQKSHTHARDHGTVIINYRPMDKWDAKRVRAAIHTIMKKKGLNIPRWTKDAGLADSTLRNFLDEISQNLNLESAVNLAWAAKVTLSQLIGEEPLNSEMKIDLDLMARWAIEVEGFIKSLGIDIQRPIKAEVAAALYRMHTRNPDEPVQIAGTVYENVVRLMVRPKG